MLVLFAKHTHEQVVVVRVALVIVPLLLVPCSNIHVFALLFQFLFQSVLYDDGCVCVQP